MEQLLLNQVAIVTGATAGIGKAIALKFAQYGARVVVVGTNRERGELVVAEINALNGPGSAQFYCLDVSKTAEVDQAVKQILEQFGSVDILVNNAGITKDQLLLKMSEEEWDKVFEVNVKSCYNFCHALVRSMLKARKGKIINISSVVGLIGNIGQVNYAASKAAIIGFTKALAKELASRHICVNCVAPGFIETSMTDVLKEETKNALLSSIPQGRLGLPEEVANAVLFLASNLSDYVTGQVINVDGGMVM